MVNGSTKGIVLTLFTDAKDFPSVVHGTYYKCLPLILTTGLNRMAREHIHFAPGVHLDGERKVISGMRFNCEVAIFIDLAQVLADGILFFVGANRVLLTEGIHGVLPPKYFARVVDIKSNSPLTDRDIKMHTDKAALLTLPESTVPDTSTIIPVAPKIKPDLVPSGSNLYISSSNLYISNDIEQNRCFNKISLKVKSFRL